MVNQGGDSGGRNKCMGFAAVSNAAATEFPFN